MTVRPSLAGKTVSITGVGGFIGLAFARAAIAAGAKITGLERDRDAADRARQAGAFVVVGDVNDREALGRAFEGADVVVHTAAVVEESADLAVSRRVNVEGTRSVGTCARQLHVGRLVHVSSIMVYGFSPPALVSEDGPQPPEPNTYCLTKRESDAVARGLHGDGLDVVVVRPGDVYGAGSVPWVTRPLALLRKRLFMLPVGGRALHHPLDVHDLVDALLAACTLDVAGEAFNVTGPSVTTSTFFDHHARMLGRRHVPTVPTPVLSAIIGGSARLARALGRKPVAEVEGIRFLNRTGSYSVEKARQKLGWKPATSLEQGMRRVAQELGLREP